MPNMWASVVLHSGHRRLVPASQNYNHFPLGHALAQLTCEAAGLCQQERAPGHEEKEGRLQQGEAVQLGELGDVGVELKKNTHRGILFTTTTSQLPTKD